MVLLSKYTVWPRPITIMAAARRSTRTRAPKRNKSILFCFIAYASLPLCSSAAWAAASCSPAALRAFRLLVSYMTRATVMTA